MFTVLLLTIIVAVPILIPGLVALHIERQSKQIIMEEELKLVNCEHFHPDDITWMKRMTEDTDAILINWTRNPDREFNRKVISCLKNS